MIVQIPMLSLFFILLSWIYLTIIDFITSMDQTLCRNKILATFVVNELCKQR